MENSREQIKEIERASQNLIDGYINLFLHYLKSKGETAAEIESKEDIIKLIKKVADISSLSIEEKNAIDDLLSSVKSPDTMSYNQLVVNLGFVGGGSQTLMKKLRVSIFAEMERDNPEIAKEYIKTIL